MIKKAILFYYNGFKNSKLAKNLLLIVLIKVFIMFVVLKLFFFQNFLNNKFDSETQKSDYVIEQLTGKK